MYSDAQARHQIQHHLSQNFLVEAGAGTGKTTLLIARILELLVTRHARLSQIVAITFTEKAATELKERLAKELQNSSPWAAGGDVGNTGNVSNIGNIDLAPIQTIHGFCAGILRQKATEAGLDANFEVGSAAEQQQLYQNAWNGWLAEELKNPASLLKELLAWGFSLETLHDLAHELYGYRDILAAADTASDIHHPQGLPNPQESPATSPPIEAGVESGDLARLRSEVTRLVARLTGLLPQCHNRQDRGFAQIQELARRWPTLHRLSDADLSRRLLYGLPIKAAGNQKNWETPEAMREVKELFGQIQETLSQCQSQLLDVLARQVMGWLRQFFGKYETQKRQKNVVDFEDILLQTRNLLRKNRAVLAELQQQYRYFLVDEFQDTDPLQAEIIFLLTQEPQAGPEDGYRPVAGKLFLVGDPKQAIYRFRRADIEVYETVKKQLGEAAVVRITQNFRSRPGLLNWINRVFAALIQPPEDGLYQPAYIPLLPSRESLAAAPVTAPVIFLAEANGTNSTDAADSHRKKQPVAEVIAQEAAAIAWMMTRMYQEQWPVEDGTVRRPVAWRDMAILLRRFSYLESFERQLLRRRIPYQVVGDTPYFSRLEIRSLMALLKALAEPGDALSLVSALRSPIFNVPDPEIFAYCHEHGSLSYRAAPEAKGYLGQIMSLLSRLHEQSRQLPWPAFIQEVLAQTGMPFTFGTMPEGAACLANFQKIWELGDSLVRKGMRDFSQLVQWLTAMEQAGEGSSALAAESQDDCVRILSIHRAKGLEFPVVFLGDLAGKSVQVPSLLPDRERGQIHVRIQGKLVFKTAQFDAQKELEKKRLEAEEIRLLYVAMTRAKEYLVVPLAAKNRGYLKLLEPFLPMTEAVDSAACTVIQVPTLAESQEAGRPEAIVDVTRELPLSPQTVASWAARQQWIASWQQRQRYGQDHLAANSYATVASRNRVDAVVSAVLRLLEPLASDDMFFVAEAMELAIREANYQSLAPQEMETVCRMIEHAVTSPLLLRASRSKKLYRELPWVWQKQTRLTGTIPLLFQEQEKWVAVFPKADLIAASQVATCAQSYHEEMAMAIAAVEKWGKIQVDELLLFFLYPGVIAKMAVKKKESPLRLW